MYRLAILRLGRFSSDFYIQDIERQLGHPLLALDTGMATVYHCDFARINAQLPDQFVILDTIVPDIIAKITAQQAEYILLPNITLHHYIDQSTKIPQSTKDKLIHPIRLLDAQSLKDKPILILGTKYSMNSAYLNEYFEQQRGKSIHKLSNKQMSYIDELRTKVFRGDHTAVDIEQFNNHLQEWSDDYQVVVACTELSVIHREEERSVLDLSRLQIGVAVRLLKIQPF